MEAVEAASCKTDDTCLRFVHRMSHVIWTKMSAATHADKFQAMLTLPTRPELKPARRRKTGQQVFYQPNCVRP
eukprot:2329264-Pleurochrysis_carterae.AAC.1